METNCNIATLQLSNRFGYATGKIQQKKNYTDMSRQTNMWKRKSFATLFSTQEQRFFTIKTEKQFSVNLSNSLSNSLFLL